MVAGHLTWEKGGQADVVSIDGDGIVLRSTTSAPPGARLSSTLTEEPSVVVKVKSHGTHREEDGTFTLKGRLIDVTREVRQRLAGLATK